MHSAMETRINSRIDNKLSGFFWYKVMKKMDLIRKAILISVMSRAS